MPDLTLWRASSALFIDFQENSARFAEGHGLYHDLQKDLWFIEWGIWGVRSWFGSPSLPFWVSVLFLGFWVSALLFTKRFPFV